MGPALSTVLPPGTSLPSMNSLAADDALGRAAAPRPGDGVPLAVDPRAGAGEAGAPPAAVPRVEPQAPGVLGLQAVGRGVARGGALADDVAVGPGRLRCAHPR